MIFPGDDAVATANLSNTPCDRNAIVLEFKSISFLSAGWIVLTCLSMKFIPIKVFTDNVSATLNVALV